MIYISTLVILFFFSQSKKYNRELFFLGVVLIMLQTCLRASSIGIDTSSGYLSIFRYIQMGIGANWIEPGWIFINKLVVALDVGYEGVLAIAGILTIIPVAYVIYNNCDNRCLGLSIYYGLYFVLFSFNLMRQCIAISFVLLAMHFYNKKKKCKSGVMLVFAFLFHKSSIIALVVVLIEKISFTFRKALILLFLSLIVGALVNARVLSLVAGKYAGYLTSDNGYNGFRSEVFMPFIMVLLVTIFFLAIFANDFGKNEDNLWFKIVIIGLAAMNATFQLGQGTRLVLYFSQAQAVFMPYFFSTIENRRSRGMIVATYLIYLSLNFMRMLFAQWDTVTPYMTFWQEMIS